MKERKGLDKIVNTQALFFVNKESENQEKKILKEKIEKFNKRALKCPNSCWKVEDKNLKIKIFWCKKINKGCHFNRCPYLKDGKLILKDINSVND